MNPEARKGIAHSGDWRGARGLAEDVRYYGAWMRDEAKKRIGHLYPKGPNGETVIAWLWARTVRCPNPACGADMPLVRSFSLSKKANKKVWAEPVVEGKKVRFEVKEGADGPLVEGTVNRKGATCVVCDAHIPFNHVRSEGKAGRMDQQLMAVVAEGQRGRKYLPATDEHVEAAEKSQPYWRPEQELPHNPRDFKTPNYGMTTFADLFTPRQLVTLDAFSDLVGEAREKALRDALAAGLPNDSLSLNKGGTGAQAYADAVTVYLGLGTSKLTDYNSTIVLWSPTRDQAKATFARQAIPMAWDFTEINLFADAAGDMNTSIAGIAGAIRRSPLKPVNGARTYAERKSATLEI